MGLFDGFFGGGGGSSDSSGSGSNDDDDSGGSTGGTPGFGGQGGSDSGNSDSGGSTGGTPGFGGQGGSDSGNSDDSGSSSGGSSGGSSDNSDSDNSDSGGSTGGTPGFGGQGGSDSGNSDDSGGSTGGTPGFGGQGGSDSGNSDSGGSTGGTPGFGGQGGSDSENSDDSGSSSGGSSGGSSNSSSGNPFDVSSDNSSSGSSGSSGGSSSNDLDQGETEANVPDNNGPNQELGPKDKAFRQIQNQTEANLSRNDVEIKITEEGKETTVTDDGTKKENTGLSVSAELEESGLRKEAGATSEQFESDDFLVSRNGQIFVSNEAQKEQIASESSELEADDIILQDKRADPSRVDSSGELAGAISGTRPTENDVVTSININDQDKNNDIFSGGVEAVEGGLSEVAQVASGNEDTSVEFRGNGSLAQQGQKTADMDINNEAFGGRSKVEESLRNIADSANKRIFDPISETSGDSVEATIELRAKTRPGSLSRRLQTADEIYQGIQNPDSVENTGEFLNNAILGNAELDRSTARNVFRGEQAETSEQSLTEDLSQGGTKGAGAIANVPGLAVGVIEVGEVGVAGVSDTAQGDADEFAKKAAGAGALAALRTTKAAASNPEQFTGQVVGSAATTSGIIKGARAVGGPRAGRAASAAIQPGEEAAIFAARRGVPGSKAIANRIGDVSVNKRANEFVKDESGQFRGLQGRSQQESSSNPEVEQDTQPEITSIDETFGTKPTRQPEILSDTDAARAVRQGRAGRSSSRRQRIERSQRSEVQAKSSAEFNRFDFDGINKALEQEVAIQATNQGGQERIAQAERSRVLANSRLDTRLESLVRTDIRSETRQETRLETREETRTETRQETRLESRVEARAEARVETRIENRSEVETEPDREIKQRFANVDKKDSSGKFDKELLNPVTKPENVAENTQSLIDDATDGIDLDLEES